MRVFVYEHTCATGGEALAGLRVEGRAMLAAVLTDFAKLRDVVPATLVAADVGSVGEWPTRVVYSEEVQAAFHEEARAADWTLVIAPETDGVLTDWRRVVEEVGGRLLGPSAAATALAADKYRLAEHWRQHGVATPPTTLGPTSAAALTFPVVCKPRFGAGSQATFRLDAPADLAAALDAAAAEGFVHDLIFQPWIPGLAASIAWLVGPAERLPLLAATQELSADGRCTYRGGRLPLSADLALRAVAASRPAVESVPGLLGYVGVDLVLGAAADGSDDWAIELNPRLTTSYVGLRALAVDNLAGAMLRVAAGERLEPIRWRSGEVSFTPEGRTA
jgi:predicted ATP-grasp superfamily ATP-dependent carboligase